MKKCPNCSSPNITTSGTKLKNKWYDNACNNCGYVWDDKKEATEK